MQTLTTAKELRATVARWRAMGEAIAFVPTMGNLHEGHLRLVDVARERVGRVVVSIFVNPMQFGEGEDFASYPRTLAEDSAKLAARGADLLFAPEVAEVYPGGTGSLTRVEVPELSDILCGAFRSGHFTGVATVVVKLLNLVQPDVALFGEKDFQQLAVIRRVVLDLNIPVEIVGVPTVRAPDGLAMSSRNGYLTVQERQVAPTLYQSLQEAAQRVLEGGQNYTAVEADTIERLRRAGFRPEYVSVRRTADLKAPTAADRDLVILGAAWLGNARLIDNLTVHR
jgi:pantoate--beta-alanine ligase